LIAFFAYLEGAPFDRKSDEGRGVFLEQDRNLLRTAERRNNVCLAARGYLFQCPSRVISVTIDPSTSPFGVSMFRKPQSPASE
jgi:hypothetical protein